MTMEEAIQHINEIKLFDLEWLNDLQMQALEMAIEALKAQPCDDAISRDDAIRLAEQGQIQGFEWQFKKLCTLPLVTPQPKAGHYEKHIDHTDCIWYGSDSGCPVTCSQYRDGWNDAMDYIFKNGKGYQPYRYDD